MKKFVILACLTLCLSTCSCAEKPLINSAEIHSYSVDTEDGRFFANTTGQYLYSEQNGEQPKRLMFGREVSSLCYSNGSLYYLDVWDDQRVLYKYDGAESVAVTDADDYRVLENTVFYILDKTLYKLESGKTEPTVITDNADIVSFNVDSKYIYWSQGSDNNLYRANHKGEKVTQLTFDSNVSHISFSVKDGYIYFAGDGEQNLYRMSCDGKELQVLESAVSDWENSENYISVYDFVLHGEWIYYNGGECRMKLDGSEKEKFLEKDKYFDRFADYRDFDVDGSYLYYSMNLEDTKTNLVRVAVDEALNGDLENIKIIRTIQYPIEWINFKKDA